MKILVTGGAGFIGSNFIHYLYRRDKDIEITVLDKLTYSANLDNINEYEGRKGYKLIKGDICDPNIVKYSMKGVDVVVNFAAEVAVDRSIDDSTAFLQTDIWGVYTLLNETRKHKSLKRFIQISTDEVYGHIMKGSFMEDAELKPRNPYAASKTGGDRLAYSFFETYGIPVIITRASNTYGPRAYPEKVIPLFITNLFDNLQVPVYGKGEQVRDWLFVDDHCSAIYTLIEKGTNGEVYNIGGEQECTNLELTRRIITAMGKDEASIKFVKDRPGHDFRYSLNCEKLKKLGWKQEYTLEKGIEMTVQWYCESEDGWRHVKSSMDRRYISGYWGYKR